MAYMKIASKTETATNEKSLKKYVAMNNGHNIISTNDKSFILLYLSPKNPDKICPIIPNIKIPDTNKFDFSQRTTLKTDGINVLKTVKTMPTIKDSKQNIFNILS